MALNRMTVLRVGAAVAAAVLGAPTSAQQDETYKGRLSAVPIDFITAPATTGSGTVTATLTGSVVSVSGEFEGLNSAATHAHVHRAPRGMRGPRAFDLEVTKGTSGSVKGRITMTEAQIEDLRRGWYFVMIHTENNPDGHLRTWLTPRAP